MEGSSLKDEMGSIFSDTAGGGKTVGLFTLVILTLWWVSIGEYIYGLYVCKNVHL